MDCSALGPCACSRSGHVTWQMMQTHQCSSCGEEHENMTWIFWDASLLVFDECVNLTEA